VTGPRAGLRRGVGSLGVPLQRDRGSCNDSLPFWQECYRQSRGRKAAGAERAFSRAVVGVCAASLECGRCFIGPVALKGSFDAHLVWLIAAVCLLACTAVAEDKPNPDQLKKAYDDALAQLKVAQDSKSALAKENEKLTKQVEDLKKEVAAGQGQIEILRRQVSDEDQKTFYLRAYQAAWQNFCEPIPIC